MQGTRLFALFCNSVDWYELFRRSESSSPNWFIFYQVLSRAGLVFVYRVIIPLYIINATSFPFVTINVSLYLNYVFNLFILMPKTPMPNSPFHISKYITLQHIHQWIMIYMQWNPAPRHPPIWQYPPIRHLLKTPRSYFLPLGADKMHDCKSELIWLTSIVKSNFLNNMILLEWKLDCCSGGIMSLPSL